MYGWCIDGFFVLINLIVTGRRYGAHSSMMPEGTPALELVLYRTYIGRVAMSKLLVRFAKDESGATAIEYGLIAAGISVAIVVIVQTVGTDLVNVFTNVSTELKKFK